ncbi:MAG TPA: hypothetical protein VIY73_03665 [Polyangiaceae bacterium]
MREVSVFRGPSASSFLVLALVALGPSVAAADDDDKRVCLSSYVEAQAARQEGHLRASQSALDRCGREVCPVVIRNDCVRWLREVTDALPTVVLSATGPDGRDRPDARVSMDGQPLADRLDGRPVGVDPGEHVFHFTLPEGGAIDARVLVREGEKDRAVTGTFPLGAPPPPTAVPVPGTPRRPIPPVVWITGGVGAASLLVSATFAGLGWFGSPGWTSSQSCRPTCSTSDIATVKQHFAIADVAGGIALVSLGVSAYFFFTRPTLEPPPVAVTVSPGGAGLAWEGRF